MYQIKGRRLVEVNELLKKANEQTKNLRNEKKSLENDIMNYLEQIETKNDPNPELEFDGIKIKLKKSKKQKALNEEILKTSLYECIKDTKKVDDIAKAINDNREKYIGKSLKIF